MRVVQHWLLLASAWGERRCSLYQASATIREFTNDLVRALDSFEALTQELVRIQEVLQKVARRDKRKQPGTFELLNDPSRLGYEA